MLALRLLGHVIHAIIERGGRVLDPDGADFQPDVYFGPLLCAPDPNAKPPR